MNTNYLQVTLKLLTSHTHLNATKITHLDATNDHIVVRQTFIL